jgi:hypothetical protein
MPAHHKLEAFLDEYLSTVGIRNAGKSPLFRSAAGKTGMLTERPTDRVHVYEMVRRRTAAAGFKVKLGCHLFRANRDHRLSRSRRNARKSAGNGGA